MIGRQIPTERLHDSVIDAVASDVLHALIALGYSDKEAVHAVKQLPDGVAVADGIRQALKLLAKA